jgi:PAS domain S-box-containing protein
MSTPSDTAIQRAHESVRRTMFVATLLALTGSILGLTLGRSSGAVVGVEVWLSVATVAFCVGLLTLLLLRPFGRITWVAPLTSLFFLTYLSVAAAFSFARESVLLSFLVYLMWFFPLLAFNRFVNVSFYQRQISLAIYIAALALAIGRIALTPVSETEVPLLLVYCLCITAFALILELFANFREAYIAESERADALQATQQAVQASEAAFRRTLSKAASGIGWITADGRCQHVNATFGTMLERAPHELEGMAFEALLAPASLPQWRQLAPDTQQGAGADVQMELQLTTASGKPLWVKMSFAVAAVEPNAPPGLVFVCLDNTAAREMESRLRQSQRLESIGQLTGGIAHDFNNLLTVILGNAELLHEQLADNPKLAPLANMVVSAGERGAQLTQRLLAFARRQALDPKPVDINQLVAEMEPLLRRSLGAHIEIELIRGAGLWPALVDPAQLDNALLNLCLNARDAMPHGGRLTIETGHAHLSAEYAEQNADVRPGQYVMLAVSDTGSGIASEHLRRVFEPFFTTKTKGKGTGLGLSMIYGFAKQTGGHVGVYSEQGAGSTFKIYLPRALEAATASHRPTASLPATGGSETIVLVEDDDLVRRYAQELLEGLGYRVLEASSGAQALRILKEVERVDLLFTDVVMPGMSGRQLADQAQALLPDLQVLFTSGYTENAIVHHGRLDPGVQLLSKPYRREDLARRIREMLNRTA